MVPKLRKALLLFLAIPLLVGCEAAGPAIAAGAGALALILLIESGSKKGKDADVEAKQKEAKEKEAKEKAAANAQAVAGQPEGAGTLLVGRVPPEEWGEDIGVVEGAAPPGEAVIEGEPERPAGTVRGRPPSPGVLTGRPEAPGAAPAVAASVVAAPEPEAPPSRRARFPWMAAKREGPEPAGPAPVAPEGIEHPRTYGKENDWLQGNLRFMRFGNPGDYRISTYVFGVSFQAIPKPNKQKFYASIGADFGVTMATLTTPNIGGADIIDHELDSIFKVPFLIALELHFVASEIKISKYGYYEVDSMLRFGLFTSVFDDATVWDSSLGRFDDYELTLLDLQPQMAVLVRRLAGGTVRALKYIEPYAGLGVNMNVAFFTGNAESADPIDETFFDARLTVIMGVRARVGRFFFAAFETVFGVNEFDYLLSVGAQF